ncbi:MAG: diaminopimelate decarboxylase [Eubacteriales bacterium]|nr:diaminopimelate decarboxylase [Eubacteriales bacterium]
MAYSFTQENAFYGSTDPQKLLEKYGSPLYVYNEEILRKRCREMKSLVAYEHFSADYSTKANANLHLLKIVREEGLEADAMSPGEIEVLLAAGFAPEKILFVCNNVSADEMAFAVERGVTVSVDSLSQLVTFGKRFPGHKVAVRLNTGHGAGHHEFVVTAGKKTKFGINDDKVDRIQAIVRQYDLHICGINQHIGSLFMDEDTYVQGAKILFDTAMQFPELEFVDMGGGFGTPYHKQEGEKTLDLAPFRRRLDAVIEDFVSAYGRRIKVKSEPGRYIVAECCALLGQVYSIKENGGVTYVGTDLGFNVLQRVVMYGAHHDLEVYREGKLMTGKGTPVTVVGNICESGDKLAENRELPEIRLDDVIGVMDAGAYGYSMASTYNNRLRPAEVLICADGSDRLIRRRETFADLMRGFDVE